VLSLVVAGALSLVAAGVLSLVVAGALSLVAAGAGVFFAAGSGFADDPALAAVVFPAALFAAVFFAATFFAGTCLAAAFFSACFGAFFAADEAAAALSVGFAATTPVCQGSSVRTSKTIRMSGANPPKSAYL
jgi:hypothetical protein